VIRQGEGWPHSFAIDYRPQSLGSRGHAAGRRTPTSKIGQGLRALHTILADCDRDRRHQEEVHIAGGVEDTLCALRKIRFLSKPLSCENCGPMGCVVFRMPSRPRI